MEIKEQLAEDMKQAMKDKDAGKLRLAVIRMVRASIKNAEIQLKTSLNEMQILDIIAKEVKLRRDAVEEFRKAERTDLVDTYEQEIAVLIKYLPEQLSEGEIRELVKLAIEETRAASAKDMGKVMSALLPKVKGRADTKFVNSVVREFLK